MCLCAANAGGHSHTRYFTFTRKVALSHVLLDGAEHHLQDAQNKKSALSGGIRKPQNGEKLLF